MSSKNLSNRTVLLAIALGASIFSGCSLGSAGSGDEAVADDQEALTTDGSVGSGCDGSSLDGFGSSFNGLGSEFNGFGSGLPSGGSSCGSGSCGGTTFPSGLGVNGFGSGFPPPTSSCGGSCAAGATPFGNGFGDSFGLGFNGFGVGINSFGGDATFPSCGGQGCDLHP